MAALGPGSPVGAAFVLTRKASGGSRLGLGAFAAALLSACGAALPPPAATPPPPPAWGTVDGYATLVAPNPAAPAVSLSLWVAAGAGDAEPAQAATLAAWHLVDGSAPPITASVFPHATRLATSCAGEALDACVTRLVAAVDTPDSRPLSLEQWITEAARARERQNPAAGDTTVRLALLALSAGASARWEPLGDRDGDSRVTRASVRDYEARVLRRAPRLLVAHGPVTERALRDAMVARAGRGAAFTPAWVGPAPVLGDGVRAEAGEVTRVGVAVALGGVAAAEAAAARCRRVGLADVELRVFGAAGRGLVYASWAGADALDRGEALTHALWRCTGGSALSPTEGRLLPESWAMATRNARGPSAWGLGLELGAESRLATDAAVLRARAWLDARDRWERQAKTAREGARDARVTLPGGGRVLADTGVATSEAAVLLRFEGGGALDGAAHGVSSVLAHTLASLCTEQARGELARVRDGHVAPFVEPDGWGLVAQGRAEDWAPLLEATLGCMTTESVGDAALERGRLAALQTAAGTPPEAVWLAETLAPGAPGAVVPAGTREALTALVPAELVRAWTVRLRESPLTVALAGPIPLEQAFDHVARALARRTAPTRSAAALAPAAPMPPREAVPVARTRAEGPPTDMRVMVAYAAARDAAPAGLGACEEALAAAWRGAGAPVTWRGASEHAPYGHVAVAVRLPTALAPELPALIARRVDDALEAVWPAAWARFAAARARRTEHAAGRAFDLIAGQGAAPVGEPAARSACGRALASVPIVVIERAQPDRDDGASRPGSTAPAGAASPAPIPKNRK